MRIKKKQLNEYLLCEADVWIRNFCKHNAPKIDINVMSKEADHAYFLQNEMANLRQRRGRLTDNINLPNIIIISNGYEFQSKHLLLEDLPKTIRLITTNRALANWRLKQRGVSYFVTNNPYEQAMSYLPTEHGHYPFCIASTRTYPDFISAYKGDIFFYLPTPTKHYQLKAEIRPMVDDYRNPIAAAIHLAYLFNVKKLLLFCCDDSFSGERPAAVQLENGLWTYPQQIMSQYIIDGCLYWLRQSGVKTGYCSAGINYVNAEYIPLSEIAKFFDDNDE